MEGGAYLTPLGWTIRRNGEEFWYLRKGVGGVGSEMHRWFAYPNRDIPGCNRLGPYATSVQAQDELELLVALDDVEQRLWPESEVSEPNDTAFKHLLAYLRRQSA